MAKKLSAKQKKLAAFAPPRNKITRADIITAAKNKFIDVSVAGITYRISVEAVEPVTTFQDVAGIGFFKTPKMLTSNSI